MAQQQGTTDTNVPETLYKQCLRSYVGKLNSHVNMLESVQYLRCLPPGVLIDIFVLMSESEEAIQDMLLEQMSQLDVFGRLLRFQPARQSLFYCLAELTSSNKPLVAQLQRNFTIRYHMDVTATKSSRNKEVKVAALDATELPTRGYAKKQEEDIETAEGAADAAKEEHNDASSINRPKPDPYTNLNVKPSGSASVSSSTNNENENSNTNTNCAVSSYTEVADKPLASVQETTDDILAAADNVTYEFGPDAIDFGMRLGSFLSEAGWLPESMGILQCVAAKLRSLEPEPTTLLLLLDCLQRLLYSEVALCDFKSAERTFNEMFDLCMDMLPGIIPKSLVCSIYAQFSAMYCARSEYDDSHICSVAAVRYLEDKTPEIIVVDVLRQAAKACLVKREFQRANIFICEAMRRARKFFGLRHQKYADTLLDYGLFLLNVDNAFQSVNVYIEALDIKRFIFGDRNFHVAIAHEDVSYAYYMNEYCSDSFMCTRVHIEKAVSIMRDLVPDHHLKLASAQRIQALLLEEIALDEMIGAVKEQELLKQSEKLHKFGLQLSVEVFGEMNVQTAKHYGNLGRLYHTMNRLEESECMHRKAIQIKTALLGPYDYEVGISLGQLASLYNYQMKKYQEAEYLYMRSIEIGQHWFGGSYSALKYDYLGLMHMYEKLREFEKYMTYSNMLENWHVLRGENVTIASSYTAISKDLSLEEIQNQFHNIYTNL